MAEWSIKNVRIAGISAVFPKHIVRTEDFSFFNEEEAEIFNKTVGIKERRIADENTCASDLCQRAFESLINALGWDREDINILIFESITPDFKTPPSSCILQERLGLSENCFCLDVPMGCCGFLYALNLGGNLLSNGNNKKAILLVGDTTSKTNSPLDKSRVPLFGDGGTAIALEFDSNAPEIVIEFHTLGKEYQALMTPHGGFRHPITPQSFDYEDFGNGIVRAPIHSLINGMNVYSFAISKPPKSILNFIERHRLSLEDLDYLLIHQANKMILDRISKKLKVPADKIPLNLDRYGNLGGASIPALMVTELRDQLTKNPETTLLLSSFGLGLTWATAYINVSKITIPQIQYL